MAWAQQIYRLLMLVLLPLWLAALWWRGRKQPAYRQGWAERLGLIAVKPTSIGGVLLHATSVGEMQAAQPLIKSLLQRLPKGALTVSCQTPTGADTFRALQLSDVRQIYWPIDAYGPVHRLLNRLQPRLVVLMEREIWPEMMAQCRERAIPVVIINARLTERSARGYRRLSALMRPIWPQLAIIAAAEEASAQRYRTLGADPNRVIVTGNIKFDAPAPSISPPMGLPPLPDLGGREVIVAGSTHEVEEKELLDAWPAFQSLHPLALLVLVPRHPQRFEAVAKSLEQRDLPFVRRSLGQSPNWQTQILLADTMGELPAWYRQAHVCFIGGSIAPIGGHNALEALGLGKPVLFGPHTQNFEALYQEVLQSRAGILVRSGEQVLSHAHEWLSAPLKIEPMSKAAQAFFSRNQGACARSVDALALLLPPEAKASATVASKQVGPSHVWWDANCFDTASPEMFDAQTLANLTPSTGSGRGAVQRFDHNGRALMLRHYRRGGLMAKFSKDAFWRERPEQSRAMQEFSLLRHLNQWGLPVPLAVAAHQRRGFLFYRADLILQWIDQSNNVVELLTQRRLSTQEWRSLGRAVGELHDRQVYHSDLNAHNLMLDATGKAWIVDFDKCGFRPNHAWKPANLQRLLRSLRKEAALHTVFHWHTSDWDLFLDAYRGASQAPADPVV